MDVVALVAAFERAAGRLPVRGRPAPTALDLFARRVVDAGRRIEAEPPVPSGWLRRAAAIGEPSPAGGRAAALWRLLFDSWAQAAPALRGPRRPRFLRFGGRGGALDLEMVVGAEGEVHLRGTVDGPTGDLALAVLPRRGRPARVPVRAGGAFAATLPVGTAPFTVAVRCGRRTLVRTGRIPPPSRG